MKLLRILQEIQPYPKKLTIGRQYYLNFYNITSFWGWRRQERNWDKWHPYIFIYKGIMENKGGKFYRFISKNGQSVIIQIPAKGFWKPMEKGLQEIKISPKPKLIKGRKYHLNFYHITNGDGDKRGEYNNWGPQVYTFIGYWINSQNNKYYKFHLYDEITTMVPVTDKDFFKPAGEKPLLREIKVTKKGLVPGMKYKINFYYTTGFVGSKGGGIDSNNWNGYGWIYKGIVNHKNAEGEDTKYYHFISDTGTQYDDSHITVKTTDKGFYKPIN